MVYIEKKEINNNVYYYHTVTIRQFKKIKKYRRYIGSEKNLAKSKLEFYKSLKYFSGKTSLYVPPKINFEHYTYNSIIIEEIYNNNNLIYHLREFDKNFNEIVEKEFPIKFIYNSNSIEGSRLTEKEVKEILKGASKNIKNKNEVQEVKNSQRCWDFIKKDFKFNFKSIKEIHKILTFDLMNSFGDYYTQGFKKMNIIVGFEGMPTTDPKDVRNELKKLLIWYKENKNKEFSIKVAFDFYYRFELIHPFEDGNGRVGRFLLNKILIDNKYQPLIVFEGNKESHHRAFVRAQRGNDKYFYDFMFKQYRKTFKEFYLTEIKMEI